MKKEYDLIKRTTKFSEDLVVFCKSVKQDRINQSMIAQLIRSGTSIGANYMEANQAASKKDFYNKIRISQKEANETKYWCRMIAKAIPEKREKIKELWKEAHELTLILAKNIKKL